MASLISGIIVLSVIGAFIIMPIIESLEDEVFMSPTYFDNSTPEATAISIARLNDMQYGFDFDTINNASLTSDGKYWIVHIIPGPGSDYVVTVDAKTWMSKSNIHNGIDGTENEWISLDELKAEYIAKIQSYYNKGGGMSRPTKVLMEGEEIWKVTVNYYNENNSNVVAYIYIDTATGKSKNTLPDFNNASGTDGWLTLKQVDDTITKLNPNSYSSSMPFKDALRNLYPE